MSARAIIFGCSGLVLGAEESAFLRDADPWGFCLFARNCESPAQMRRLTADLREAVGRDAPVLIDQEGGRVQRMRGPTWRDFMWTPRLREDFAPKVVDEALALRFRLIAHELALVGVDVDAMPLLDVTRPETNPIIADRALGATPDEVMRRGRIAVEALGAGGVAPIVKHMPGQGRATGDTHDVLPRVDASLEALREVDFAPFRAFADLAMGMTGHMVLTALDPDRPATQSPACIQAIREDIGFGGLLMTDDLGMDALSGTPADRSAASLAAGCDVILHCNATRDEALSSLSVVPRLEGAALARAQEAEAARGAAQDFDPTEADARLKELTGEGADA